MVHRLKNLPLWSVYALLAYMPFHLFLSRWLSLYTGGLGQWDAAKDIFTCAAVLVCVFLFFKEKLYKKRLAVYVFVLSAAYLLVHLFFLLFDWENNNNRPFVVATLYNGRVMAWVFIGLVASLLRPDVSKKTIIKIIMITSTLTCLFALAQYLLPKDLMEHFGYSIERGAKPSFFIDDKVDFPRVMSTVRDPNSYGAFLILPITILWFCFIKKHWPRVKIAVLLLLHMLALLLTFSRGAWLGAIIALAASTIIFYKNQLISFTKKRYPFLIATLVALAGLTFVFRDTYVFKNVILHSDESTVQADPNELRVQLQQRAVNDIVNNPQGHGPGTAGLASIGNPRGTFLTENYYLQIGYEVGIVGLLIFLIILSVVFWYMLAIKNIETRAVVLGCFLGYLFIGLLIHLWSNESVAAQWWLVTGLVLGLATGNTHNKKAPKN